MFGEEVQMVAIPSFNTQWNNYEHKDFFNHTNFMYIPSVCYNVHDIATIYTSIVATNDDIR